MSHEPFYSSNFNVPVFVVSIKHLNLILCIPLIVDNANSHSLLLHNNNTLTCTLSMCFFILFTFFVLSFYSKPTPLQTANKQNAYNKKELEKGMVFFFVVSITLLPNHVQITFYQ